MADQAGLEGSGRRAHAVQVFVHSKSEGEISVRLEASDDDLLRIGIQEGRRKLGVRLNIPTRYLAKPLFKETPRRRPARSCTASLSLKAAA